MIQRLTKPSIQAAIEHLKKFGDTDLFPQPFEIEAIVHDEEEIVKKLSTLELGGNYQWNGGARHCLVPKDHFGYRRATQLDPLDALVLTGIMFQYGAEIEQTRIPRRDEVVFSYRFEPKSSGELYELEDQWSRFWNRSLEIAKRRGNGFILVADIADFYNQVYHHTVENELARCGLHAGVINCILNLLKSVTQTVSRGLPVGSQAIHLLAELSLDPVDRSVKAQGRDYCRFVDDIHIGCKDERDAAVALQHLYDTLDKQQKLLVQRHKVRIVPAALFSKECLLNLKDRPLDQNEERMVEIIQRRTRGPYTVISHQELNPEDLKLFTRAKLEALFRNHLLNDTANFARIRWLLRRLSQIGVPGAVNFVVSNIEKFTPCIGDACRYLLSARDSFEEDWAELGKDILEALKSPYIKHSEYVQTVLIDLFAHNPQLDNIEELLRKYDSAGTMARRKIVLAAASARAQYWIRERKEGWESSDPWLKRAIIAAARSLEPDERRHWLRHISKRSSSLELVVAHWAAD